ncbi:hypothetical protein [Thalassospira tepidiphila]|uniref:hypothetical protein n=1 Tax=Thalassospira tepidiphila TaxID=393657 RepID=UPI002925FF46|nr:hypothetical protein MACH01_30000 [Thalassospira tepidiphila]
MRFSEKSFEVRFCATFSAALMPFNRNPQWFGMTQAQERMTGIDTMLSIGGKLLIFQFKAKQDDKFKLEKFQWRNLARIGKKYPKSTYYVFPEAGDLAAAASARCLLNTSWCCDVNDIGKGFRSTAASMSLTLVKAKSALTRSKPDQDFTAQKACEVFGCFCPAFFPLEGEVVEGDGGNLFYLQVGTSSDSKVDRTFPPYPKSLAGIPIGTISGEEGGQGEPITSVEQFEQMLGDSARQNLGSGLSGLFLPSR